MTRPCPACSTTSAREAGEKNGHRLVRCRRCATLFTADAAAATYDGYYDHHNLELPAFVGRRLDEIVGGFAPARHGGRLLDVGFGAGTLLDAAQRAGWAAEGVEISAEAVAQARTRGFQAFHGMLEEAAYPSGAFDVVVAAEVFEHVVDVAAMIGEIRRILRPGGLLWATTPHGRGLSARLLGTRWMVVSPPEHVQLFSIRGLRTLLRASGFRRVAIAAESINPHELLQGLRSRRGEQGKRCVERGYALNEFLSARPSRRVLKHAANRVLALLRLGDSLKLTAWT